MKYFTASVSGIILSVVSALPVSLFGQPADEPGKEAAHAHPGGADAMQSMSGPLKMKCRIMMNMQIDATDPAALLAIKDQLDLSQEQTEQLKRVLGTARAQAEQVLTPEQRAKLQGVSDLPDTHMKMHQMMMEKMRAKMGPKQGSPEKGGMMCPMMQAMQDADGQAKPGMHEKMKQKMKMKMKQKAEPN